MAVDMKDETQPTVDQTLPETGGVNNAWAFLNESYNADTDAGIVDIEALRRTVDWHIVPLMFGCYTMQFLDKVILNVGHSHQYVDMLGLIILRYAAVMGIQKDLHLGSNDFSNIATFLFVGLLCFEIPNIYFLQKVPVAKRLGLNVVLWGRATASGAAATSYRTLFVSRVFLGIFEAAIGPSLLLISSQWYTKFEQAPRFSFWYCGLGFGQIIGGAISYGFQHVAPGAGLAEWRIMFITLGCLTVIIGLATPLLVPDTPIQARWLTDAAKVALLKHVSVNRTGIQSRTFQPRQILEALTDPQLYLLVLTVILLSVSSGVVTTYSATLIRNLGYVPKRAALMNMPSDVVSVFITLLVGFGIRKQSSRWLWIVICIVPAIIGGALMSFLPVSNRRGCLAGIYLVDAVVAPLPVLYVWTAANVSGSTKRAFAAAIVSGSFSIGNIIGPQKFQAKDAPNYRPAKLAVMGTQAGCAAVTLVLYGYYRWQNARLS